MLVASALRLPSRQGGKTVTFSRARHYLGAGVIGLALAARLDAATVSIAWDPNPEPDVTGYEVCARPASDACGSGIAIGNRTNWTFTALLDSVQYTFAVRARSSAGVSQWTEVGYFTPPPVPAGSEPSRGDFNSDGWFDLLWQHRSSGQLVAWHLNGTAVMWARVLNPTGVAPGWILTGSGDFNRDGKPDLVWHHVPTGQVVYWLMDGVLNYFAGDFPGPVDSNWRIASVRDLNGDENPDLWWHNQATGDMVVWYFNGTTLIGSAVPKPGRIADTNWKLRGTADFTGDGRPDALWHNEATGELRVWSLNGITAEWWENLNPAFVAPNWKIAAVGDATLDWWPDIVWQNEVSGELVLWTMVGTNLVRGDYLSIPTADVNWRIAGPR
jgi:FG-GAP-like repeat/Fibronectin type III domain